MLRNLALIGVCAGGLLVVGCRDDNQFTPTDFARVSDMAMSNNLDLTGSGGGDAGSTVKCSTGYTDSTIAAMRAAQKSGCFRVGMTSDVLSLAQQSTSTHSSLIVQDTAGGDSSALKTDCDTRAKAVTAGYGCTATTFASFKGAIIGNKVTVGGFYVFAKTGNLEFFNVIDTYTDSGTAGVAPAKIVLTEADVARTSTTVGLTKLWQYATVTTAGLKAYEWAPAAFLPSPQSTSCTTLPYTFGFALVPMASASVAGAACTAGTLEAAAATPGTDEILIDTSFYTNFKYTSDCKCFMAPSNLLAAAETFTKLQGIVTLETAGVPAISPLTNADIGK